MSNARFSRPTYYRCGYSVRAFRQVFPSKNTQTTTISWHIFSQPGRIAKKYILNYEILIAPNRERNLAPVRRPVAATLQPWPLIMKYYHCFVHLFLTGRRALSLSALEKVKSGKLLATCYFQESHAWALTERLAAYL